MWLGPKNAEAKDDLMRKSLREVFFPAVEARVRVVDADALALEDASAGPSAPARPSAAEPPLHDMMLFIDGEYVNLSATMAEFSNHVFDHPLLKSMSLVKLAAACSLSQQPADISTIFRALKLRLPRISLTEDADVQPSYMRTVQAKLKVMSKSSQQTYMPVLAQLVTILGDVTRASQVKEGWKKTGLYPPNVRKVLELCPVYNELTPAEAKAVKGSIDTLVPQMNTCGELRDDEIQAAVGDALIFPVKQVFDDTGRKTKLHLHEMAVGYRRAMVLTPAIIETWLTAHASDDDPDDTAAKVSTFYYVFNTSQDDAGPDLPYVPPREHKGTPNPACAQPAEPSRALPARQARANARAIITISMDDEEELSETDTIERDLNA